MLSPIDSDYVTVDGIRFHATYWRLLACRPACLPLAWVVELHTSNIAVHGASKQVDEPICRNFEEDPIELHLHHTRVIWLYNCTYENVHIFTDRS